jgi:hypothetical protein
VNKPHAEIRIVTPEWARDVLEEHDASIVSGKFAQRSISERQVKAYAEDMRAGQWSLNGQGISFDTNNNLLDGQHRLHAVVKSGISVQMLVMWDLPVSYNSGSKTINTMDIGKRRFAGAQLKMEGFMYANTVATASRVLVLAASGNLGHFCTPTQIIATSEFLKPHYEALIPVLVNGNAPPCKWSGTVVAPLALLRCSDSDTADLFAAEFNEMANLSKTSPVLQFQKYLDRPTHKRGGHAVQFGKFSAAASALYFYSNNEKIAYIKGNQDHVEWLLKVSKQAVTKIRFICGIVTTLKELEQK